MIAPIPKDRAREVLARIDENSRGIAKVVSAMVYMADSYKAPASELLVLHDAVRSLVDTRRYLRDTFERDTEAQRNKT